MSKDHFVTETLDDLLTIRKVARLFRVIPLTVRNWRARGCPSVVIPGDERYAVRFRLRQVVEWRLKNGRRVPKRIRALVDDA